MVQIPQQLERLCGKGLQLEHAFGRCDCGGMRGGDTVGGGGDNVCAGGGTQWMWV
jgi:hypothetical protein